MTPLTHAALGTLIFQRLGRLRWGGWVLAFLLAFASHYLLDAIPHFEKIVITPVKGTAMIPIRSHGYLMYLSVLQALGLIGTVLGLLLMRWNREAGRIWVVLSLWIGVGNYSFSWLRILTAAAGLGYLAWRSKHWTAPGYMLAGMLAVVPDLMNASFRMMGVIHRYFHFQPDWATRLFLAFSTQPYPPSLRDQLRNPYILLSYALELLVEGSLFLGAFYLFSREKFAPEKEKAAEIREPLELSEKS